MHLSLENFRICISYGPKAHCQDFKQKKKQQQPQRPPAEPAKANKRPSLSFLGGLLPGYFSSEWSFAQFRVREGTKYSVAFGKQPNTVLIIGMDGSFYRCRFDPEKGGDMEQLEHMNFMNLSQKTLSPPIF